LPAVSVSRWAGLYAQVDPTWADAGGTGWESTTLGEAVVHIGDGLPDTWLRQRRREIHRLVLWNIDLTLVDVVKVTRAAYAETERLLAPFGAQLATSLAARRELLTTQGQLLPGAAEAMAALAGREGIVQSVLTGSSRPNAAVKLRAFGLDRYVDLTVGGFAGSEVYPKGALLQVARRRAEDKHGVSFADKATLYVADSPRDVEAAKIGGARSVAVASGRASSAELRESGADIVLPDLTDTEAIVALVSQPV
jgi:phosphoglycolate phosphatase